MASFASRLMPLVIRLRGSKRRYASAELTRRRVAQLRAKPKGWAPPEGIATQSSWRGWPLYEVGSGDRVAIYLHGGANIYEIDTRHWGLVAELARRASIRILVPIYPLAPIDTAGPIIESVADLAVEHDAFAVLGDSAGGGMSLATAMVLRDRGVTPLRVSMISPSLDLTFTDPRVAELAKTDPWLDIPGAAAAAELYRGELPLTDPHVSSIFGSLDGLGPLQLLIGTRDMLWADALRLRDRTAAEGHPLEYHEVAGMLHVYPILPIPEAAVARTQIVEFLKR